MQEEERENVPELSDEQNKLPLEQPVRDTGIQKQAASYEAEYTLFDVPLKTYVLANGQRVVDLNGLSALLQVITPIEKQSELGDFGRWLAHLPSPQEGGE